MQNSTDSDQKLVTDDSTLRANATCNFCSTAAPTIFVHGHEQCSNCGKNVEECCQGSECVL